MSIVQRNMKAFLNDGTLGARGYYYFFYERSERATRREAPRKKITSEAIDILSYNTSTGLWNQGGTMVTNPTNKMKS